MAYLLIANVLLKSPLIVTPLATRQPPLATHHSRYHSVRNDLTGLINAALMAW